MQLAQHRVTLKFEDAVLERKFKASSDSRFWEARVPLLVIYATILLSHTVATPRYLNGRERVNTKEGNISSWLTFLYLVSVAVSSAVVTLLLAMGRCQCCRARQWQKGRQPFPGASCTL